MSNLKSEVVILFICLFLSLQACKKNTPASIKQEQYAIQGKELYIRHCSNCHQIDGSGLGQLIPPIDSAYLKNNLREVICGIKYGIEGELLIDGKKFDGKMPGNNRLTPLEIAEIVTYLRQEWGNDQSIASIPLVQSNLKSCQ